jgi:glycerol-3-phosphate dehydrogenase
VSIFGGKLTDCVNVGDEVLDAMSRFGLEVRSATLWYGSPAIPDARERRRLARELAPAHGDHGGAAMVEALWRRQGTKAPQVLAAWRRDPSSAAELVPGTRVSRAEVEHIARTELVVTAEDLLRRRTLLGQTRSPAELAAAGAVTDAAGLPDLTGLGGGP